MAEGAEVVSPVAPSTAQPADKAVLRRAQVSLAPVGTSKVSGTLVLSELADHAGVRVEGAISGLSSGTHGMHVHETPNCGSADGMSAGGHFNPTSAPHGAAGAAQSHVGDLGNIVADGEGRAAVSIIKPAATLDQSNSSLLQRSMIVHEKGDDLSTQPSGDSGARIACGIIVAL